MKKTFQVIDSFLKGKDEAPEKCEDFLIINDGFIGVIDGATAKGNPLFYEPKTSGRIAGELICSILENSKNWNLDAATIIDIINKEFICFYKNKNIFEHVSLHIVDRLIASMVLFSINKNQIWSIGDCQFIIDNKIYNNQKYSDLAISEVRNLFVLSLINQGYSAEEINNSTETRELILPFLKSALLFQNKKNNFSKFDYYVIDGFFSDLKKIKIININNNISQIIMATDGYPQIKLTLEESEIYLQHICENDPLLLTVSGALKMIDGNRGCYDDRAYVKLKK